MRHLGWLLALTLLAPIGHAAPAPLPAQGDAARRGIDDLLRSAQLWQVRRRPDLARGVLQKVLAMQADEPRALLLLGEIDLRSGVKNAALAQLAALQAHHPGSRELAELQQLASLYASDLSRLNRLQQLRDAGRNAEAATLARQVFGNARPPGLWGTELAGLIASTPGAWETSRRQTGERAAASGSALDRLALAEVLAQRSQTREQAWATYRALARGKELPTETVAASWRRAIRLQPEGTSVGPLWAALRQAMDEPDGRDPTGASAAALAGAASAALSAGTPAGTGAAPRAPSRQAARQAAPDRSRTASAVASRLPPAVAAPAAATAANTATARAPSVAGAQSEGVDARGLAQRQIRNQIQALLDAQANEAVVTLLESGHDLPGSDAVLWGQLGLAHMRLERHAQAVPAFERALQLDPKDADRWRGLRNTAHYWGTVRQARNEANAGRDATAAALLGPVIDLQPDEIEAPLLMAQVQARLGQVDPALQGYGRVLKRSPREARAWRGRFDVRVADDAESAIAELALYGPEAAKLIDVGAVRDQADRRLAQQHSGAALRLLEQAIALAPAEPWLRHDAARIYLQYGLGEEARQVMSEGRQLAASSAEMHQASGLIAMAAGEYDLAVDVLAALTPSGPDTAQRGLIQRARLEQALAQASEALATRRLGRAADWLDSAESLIGDSATQRMRMARLRLAARQPAEALALLDPIRPDTLPAETMPAWATMVAQAGATTLALDALQARLDEQPATATAAGGVAASRGSEAADAFSAEQRADAWLLHAELAIEAGLPQTARLDFLFLANELPPDDIARRQRLLGLQRRAGDLDGARATLAGLLRQAGADPAVQFEAARFAQIDDNPSAAMDHLERVRQHSTPGSDLALEAQRTIDEIHAVRQPRLEMALHGGTLEGNPGRSHLDSREATARLSWPASQGGRYFGQIDLVRLDAGALAAPLPESALFGRVLAQAGPAGLTAPAPQVDQGAAVGLGWADGDDSVDIGVVGLRVRNVVGGLAHTWRDPRGSLGLEISRRLLTGSLLSWAGARDPIDGAVWGGVTLNALKVQSELALNPADSLLASLAVGLLTGRQVAGNPMLQARIGVERDLLNTADQRLSVGLSVATSQYRRNLSFHTFGHGGYYSPQKHASIALPIEAVGRRGALSYAVRASVSQAWSQEDDAPYYPTDAAAQARAGQPMHRGGPGGGTGGSLRATLEWQAAAQWSIGATLGVERSNAYAPTGVAIYLRHGLGPVAAAPGWPTAPLTPYLRD